VNFLTKKRCLEIGENHPYYKGCYRWEYWKIVIYYLTIIDPKSCLELGAKIQSLVVDGDRIGKSKEEKPEYLWNAMDVPWPLKDKQYDVFIALQVWEHLKGKQRSVFKEVARISNWAILSFPYKWGGNSSHSKINKRKIQEWTHPYSFFIKPKIIKNKRIICIFNFSKNNKNQDKIRKKIKKI
jgi:hypothetical protein